MYSIKEALVIFRLVAGTTLIMLGLGYAAISWKAGIVIVLLGIFMAVDGVFDAEKLQNSDEYRKRKNGDKWL